MVELYFKLFLTSEISIIAENDWYESERKSRLYLLNKIIINQIQYVQRPKDILRCMVTEIELRKKIR